MASVLQLRRLQRHHHNASYTCRAQNTLLAAPLEHRVTLHLLREYQERISRSILKTFLERFSQSWLT